MELLYPASRQVADITELIAPHPRGVLRATMVIGRNGASTLNGDSAGLSNPHDRSMYWALRDQCDVIIVGSRTAQHPGYAKVDRPVVSVSREESSDLVSLISSLKDQGYRSILCEGGATFLSALMAADLVDELYLTLSDKDGDPSSSMIEKGQKNLVLKNLLHDSGYLFTHYGRISSANVGATTD